MQFQKLFAHERMQVVGKSCVQLFDLNQLLNIRQVFQPARIGHAGSELEIDEHFQRQSFDAIDNYKAFRQLGRRIGRRIWEADRFRQSIYRVFTRCDYLNRDVS